MDKEEKIEEEKDKAIMMFFSFFYSKKLFYQRFVKTALALPVELLIELKLKNNLITNEVERHQTVFMG